MNTPRYHRRSIRLQGYDYSRPGAYFVTICARNREYLFGEIVDGEMRLNDMGRMVWAVWDDLPNHYAGVALGAFVVMPNHIHGIVILVGAGPRACPDPGSCQSPVGQSPVGQSPVGQSPVGQSPVGQSPGGIRHRGNHRGLPLRRRRRQRTGLSLPDVVHRFKTMTTKRYADGVKHQGWPPFRGRLWQRNYYEHIIRSEASLQRIERYIVENPVRWRLDRENSAALKNPKGDEFEP